MPTFNGTANADTLTGSALDDVINGLGGNDTLQGGTGRDTINGGDGNDYINHNSYTTYADDEVIDTLNGGAGNDIIDAGRNDVADGGTGRDRLTIYHGGATPVNYDLSALTTAAQVQTWLNTTYGVTAQNFEVFGLVGTNGNDVIRAHNIPDQLGRSTFDGLASTTIEGLDGNDEIWGGAGIDEIYGGNGNDILRGGGGADILDGGAGDDYMDGGPAATNEGNYIRIDLGTTTQSVTIDLAITTAQNTGQGMDTILNIGNILARSNAASSFTLLGTNNYNNFLSGGDGNDTLDGRSGNDRLQGRGGADHLIGGDGVDEAVYDLSAAGVTVNLTTGVATGGDAQGDTFSSIENITGSHLVDVLTGNAVANLLIGNRGDDTLNGMAGNDDLRGGAGADTLNGGDGNDSLWGGEANEASFDNAVDTLNGGAGNDNIVVGHGDIADGGEGSDQAFVGFYERSSGIVLDLTPGARAVLEAAQNVTLNNFEFYHVFGTAHNDVITGTNAVEQFVGAEGNDVLNGMGGVDYLYGWDGDDRLDGGAGNDRMEGGAGNDTYVYTVGDTMVENANSGIDTIETATTLSIATTWANFENITLTGTANINATGNASDNLLIGNSGNNTLSGAAGNDILIGGGGNDSLQGGDGYDIAVYSGARGGYATATHSGVTGGREGGTDTISGVESLAFLDGQLNFHRDGMAAQVMRLYDTAFNRIPDGGGFEAQLDAMEGGLSLEALAQLFVDSVEFQNTYGGLTRRQFVELLYRNSLDREGDEAGIVNAVNSGLTLAQLVVSFSESTEHKNLTQGTLDQGLWIADEQTLTIARLFDSAWNRLPDEGGLVTWRNAYGAGTSLTAIADAFAGSVEFTNTYGALNTRQFVEQLYRNVLDREGDEAGIQNAVNAIELGGQSRGQVMLAFSESVEHINLTRHLWIGGVDLYQPPAASAEAGKAGDEPLTLPGADDDAFIDMGGSSGDALILPGVDDGLGWLAKGADEAQVLPGQEDGNFAVPFAPDHAAFGHGLDLLDDGFVTLRQDGWVH